jgi:hypothetical protein
MFDFLINPFWWTDIDGWIALFWLIVAIVTGQIR